MAINTRLVVHQRLIGLAARLGFILGLCTYACSPPVPDPTPPAPPVPPAPPPAPPVDDGSVEPEPTPEPEPTVEPCVRACERLQELGCKEGDPTPAGKPCEQWLCEAANAGIVDLQPDCLAEVRSCVEVDERCRDGGY